MSDPKTELTNDTQKGQTEWVSAMPNDRAQASYLKTLFEQRAHSRDVRRQCYQSSASKLMDEMVRNPTF